MVDMRLWNKDTIVELITIYKSFPCLWKIKSEEYKNKYLREEAYNELVDFCKEKGFHDANRDFVVKKIQSLRGSFRKELRKMAESQRSGRRGDEVYKTSLWYFDNLLFTKDQEIPKRGISNNDEDLEDESLTNDDDANGLSEDEQSMWYAAPTATATTSQRNKRKATLSHVSIDPQKANGKELSEYDISGMNVAKKLAKMDPLQAIYAESVISNVLRKGLLEKLTEYTDLCDNHCGWKIATCSRTTCELPNTNNIMLPLACDPSTQIYQSVENEDFKPVFDEGPNALLTEDREDPLMKN